MAVPVAPNRPPAVSPLAVIAGAASIFWALAWTLSIGGFAANTPYPRAAEGALFISALVLTLGAAGWGIVTALIHRRWGWAIGIFLGTIVGAIVFLPGLVTLIYALRVPAQAGSSPWRSALGRTAATSVLIYIGAFVLLAVNYAVAAADALVIVAFMLLAASVIIGWVGAIWAAVKAFAGPRLGWAVGLGLLLGALVCTLGALPGLPALVYAAETPSRPPAQHPSFAGPAALR